MKGKIILYLVFLWTFIAKTQSEVINHSGLDASVNYADVFDARGKKVMTINHYQLLQAIDISQLCNGMYHFVLHGDNGEQSISFSVIK
jgi:hypothetical protein